MKNEIINGKSISNYQVNWTRNDLLQHIGQSYTLQELPDSDLIVYENFKFWINRKTNKLFQIGVSGSYDGKLQNSIGLGSTLHEVKQHFGTVKEDLDVYVLPTCEGICFELSENQTDTDWVEDQIPIGSIYVYNQNDKIWV